MSEARTGSAWRAPPGGRRAIRGRPDGYVRAGVGLPAAAARGAGCGARAAGRAAARRRRAPRETRDLAARGLRRLEGEYPEDEWGFDEEFVELVEPLLGLLYERWWRVKVEAARVPAHGRALLVANHAGIVPWDATMIGMALLREHPLPRHARFLVLDWAFDLPGCRSRSAGSAESPPRPTTRCACWRTTTSSRSSPRGEGDRQAVLRALAVCNASVAAASSSWRCAAARPSFPLRSSEARRSTPRSPRHHSWRGCSACRSSRSPRPFPGSARSAWCLPSKWRIEFCDPIETAGYGPEAAGDRALVFKLSERVRDTIQQAVREPRAPRRGVPLTGAESTRTRPSRALAAQPIRAHSAEPSACGEAACAGRVALA